jgi:hypothetical protein
MVTEVVRVKSAIKKISFAAIFGGDVMFDIVYRLFLDCGLTVQINHWLLYYHQNTTAPLPLPLSTRYFPLSRANGLSTVPSSYLGVHDGACDGWI